MTGKVFIAGRYGLVGTAVEKVFRKNGYSNIVGLPSEKLDLRSKIEVDSFFEREKPEYVILAAARVANAIENLRYPAEFLFDNLSIQNNIIDASRASGVKRLIFLASACIYPLESKRPIKEEELLNGKLDYVNEAYALAKIAGIKMCEYYNRQYNTQFVSVVPCNLYGPGDNYNIEKAHVVPSLIHKIHCAKINGSKSISIWGSGETRREFMFSEDLADICYKIVENGTKNTIMNVGVGYDLSINEIARSIMSVIGYDVQIVEDNSKPNGRKDRVLDINKIKQLGWHNETNLKEALTKTYEDYLKRGCMKC